MNIEKQLRNTIKAKKAEIKNLKEKLDEQKFRLNDLEKYRRKFILINGLNTDEIRKRLLYQIDKLKINTDNFLRGKIKITENETET